MKTEVIHKGRDGKSHQAHTTPKDVDPKQLAKGIKIEREHSSDPRVQKQIALDHLTEFPNYYTGLKKMEKQLKKTAMSKADIIIQTYNTEEPFIKEAAELPMASRVSRAEAAAASVAKDSSVIADRMKLHTGHMTLSPAQKDSISDRIHLTRTQNRLGIQQHIGADSVDLADAQKYNDMRQKGFDRHSKGAVSTGSWGRDLNLSPEEGNFELEQLRQKKQDALNFVKANKK